MVHDDRPRIPFVGFNTTLKMIVMRKFTYTLLVTLFASGILIQSCTKDKDIQKTSNAELQFVIQQSDFNYKLVDDSVPGCIEGEMEYVQFFITTDDNGTITTQAYESYVLNANGKKLTQTLRLEIREGVTYTLTKFVVYRADGAIMKVAPLPGSLYHELMTNKLDLLLDLNNFEKMQIAIDVACVDDYVITGEETGFALGSHTFHEYSDANPAGLLNLDIAQRWGWAINIPADASLPYDYSYEFWAAAGHNNTDNGFLVGNVNIQYDVQNNVGEAIVTYTLSSPYSISESHVYISDLPPTTTAPGQFGHTTEFNPSATTYTETFTVTDTDNDGIWIIAHADVIGPF